MRGQIGIGALALAAAGCDGNGVTGVACTQEARPGLAVTVRDPAGEAVTGALVVAREGAYADTARWMAVVSAGAVYSLAYERAGTYVVRVERAGYQPWEQARVRVTADECHVRTVALTAALRR